LDAEPASIMRLPDPPPNWKELVGDISAKKLRELLVSATPTVRGKYLHWDELRHRTPPEGLSLEEWWLGIKLGRMTGKRKTPLLSVEGEPFYYLWVDPIPERVHEIDLGAGGQISMPEQLTNPDTRNRYLVSSLFEEAITSSQLEGAATTRRVAKEMLRTGRAPRNRSEQMILNNYLAMRRIAELKAEPLTRDLVMAIHRLVTKNALDEPDAAGRFRRPDEAIHVVERQGQEVHVPPPAGELEERMARMCAFANEEASQPFLHPALRAIILHFWLAYDHPFVDGNGRTARALFYWSMLHSGFWLFEFLPISRLIRRAPAQYSRAFLYTETDENDLTYFILYHLKVIRRAVADLNKYLQVKTKQVRVVDQLLRAGVGLNHRQRALLSHAIRHSDARYSFRSHQISHQVTYQTARNDLFDLQERGLLIRTKVGRTYYFRPVAGLEEKLRNLS